MWIEFTTVEGAADVVGFKWYTLILRSHLRPLAKVATQLQTFKHDLRGREYYLKPTAPAAPSPVVNSNYITVAIFLCIAQEKRLSGKYEKDMV